MLLLLLLHTPDLTMDVIRLVVIERFRGRCGGQVYQDNAMEGKERYTREVVIISMVISYINANDGVNNKSGLYTNIY